MGDLQVILKKQQTQASGFKLKTQKLEFQKPKLEFGRKSLGQENSNLSFAEKT